mmetsp:Transcript_6236/g.15176  ORF Transcript_6236/g.15176 Transcript_6236/m.15176 type:complete len:130 (-) Transcript_6236:123-512(-)
MSTHAFSEFNDLLERSRKSVVLDMASDFVKPWRSRVPIGFGRSSLFRNSFRDIVVIDQQHANNHSPLVSIRNAFKDKTRVQLLLRSSICFEEESVASDVYLVSLVCSNGDKCFDGLNLQIQIPILNHNA